MKHIITLMITAILMISADAWAQQQIGMLKTVSGDVKIKRSGSLVEPHPGDHLMITDTLISEDNGYAGIIFIDGTTITIGPGTEFEIASYQFKPEDEVYDFSMYLKKGTAIFNSGKIGKLSPDSVKLSTPRASVGIRGTRFIIKVQ